MPALKIVNGPEGGKVLDFGNSPLTIGRAAECDVQITEESISRHHAKIVFKNNSWHVKDLNSQNGLKVGGRKLASVKLTSEARFNLGNVTFQFSASEAGAPATDVSNENDSGENSSQTQSAIGTETAVSNSMQTLGESSTCSPADSSEAAPTTIEPPADEESGPAHPPANEQSETGDEPDYEHLEKMAEIYPAIEQEFGRVIVGQRGVLEELLVAITANGHCLMIGLPGLAKTLMVSTLAGILEQTFRRVQFTPDLMPADILGTEVLDTDETSGRKSFRFMQGPIFTNILLADEINRTPPKTQSALLESMQEHQVSIANKSYALPEPFFVLATQNPLEQEGTYPLPEAQLDRFMFNIVVDYPEEEEEEKIVAATTGASQKDVERKLSGDDILALQKITRQLPVSSHVVKYATRLVRATRPADKYATEFIRDYVYCGAGPRAAQNLILGSKARAVVQGRANVSCNDVRTLALPVLRHRLFTNFSADSEGFTPDTLVSKLTETISEPTPDEY